MQSPSELLGVHLFVMPDDDEEGVPERAPIAGSTADVYR
jgi:hypothetical protein